MGQGMPLRCPPRALRRQFGLKNRTMTRMKSGCGQCRKIRHEPFESEAALIRFERLLRQSVDSGVLAKMHPVSRADACISEDHYRCSNCGTIWVLSFPDQAYRGSCQPLERVI
jgi:hypothetical protein